MFTPHQLRLAWEVGVGQSLKHFFWWLVITGVAFMISAASHNWFIGPGWFLASGLVYMLDCKRRPMRPCWRCGGQSNNRSPIWKYATGQCSACGRSGRQRRLGAVIFGFYE